MGSQSCRILGSLPGSRVELPAGMVGACCFAWTLPCTRWRMGICTIKVIALIAKRAWAPRFRVKEEASEPEALSSIVAHPHAIRWVGQGASGITALATIRACVPSVRVPLHTQLVPAGLLSVALLIGATISARGSG